MSGADNAWRLTALNAVLGLALLAAPGHAAAFGLFSKSPAKAQNTSAANSAQAADMAARMRQALDEQRYVDAGSIIDQANINNIHSPQLTVLTGELYLARGHFDQAMTIFSEVEGESTQRAAALQGKGIALSMLGRSDEALAALKTATTLDKTLWRAWNGLGREYDVRRDWPNAIAAYDSALAVPGARTAVVLNNRGFSLLLQNQAPAAAADFVAALSKDPSLAAARTNLRIALAWQGAYERAAVTGAGDDRAAVLNNVGLAAALHGDYDQAEKYLTQAMAARGEYYDRASENLQLTHGLAERRPTAAVTVPTVVH